MDDDPLMIDLTQDSEESDSSQAVSASIRPKDVHSPLTRNNFTPKMETPAEGDVAPSISWSSELGSMSPTCMRFNDGRVRVKVMPGDGDCLYRACLHQRLPVSRRYLMPADEEVADLRSAVALFMRENPRYYADFFPDGDELNRSIRSVEDGAWGDSLSLNVIASMWRVRIHVYYELGAVITHYPVDEEGNVAEGVRCLRVAFRCVEDDDGRLTHNHYDSVVEVVPDDPGPPGAAAVPAGPSRAASSPRGGLSSQARGSRNLASRSPTRKRMRTMAAPGAPSGGSSQELVDPASPTPAFDAPGSPDACEGSQESQEDMYFPLTESSPASASQRAPSRTASERGRANLDAVMSPSPSASSKDLTQGRMDHSTATPAVQAPAPCPHTVLDARECEGSDRADEVEALLAAMYSPPSYTSPASPRAPSQTESERGRANLAALMSPSASPKARSDISTATTVLLPVSPSTSLATTVFVAPGSTGGSDTEDEMEALLASVHSPPSESSTSRTRSELCRTNIPRSPSSSASPAAPSRVSPSALSIATTVQASSLSAADLLPPPAYRPAMCTSTPAPLDLPELSSGEWAREWLEELVPSNSEEEVPLSGQVNVRSVGTNICTVFDVPNVKFSFEEPCVMTRDLQLRSKRTVATNLIFNGRGLVGTFQILE